MLSSGAPDDALPGGLPRARARSLLRRRAPLSVLPPAVLPAVAAVTALVLLAMGQWAVVAAAAAVAGLIVVASGPWRRPSYGLEVTGRTQPELYGLVVEAARTVGTRLPDGIWLVGVANALAAVRRPAWWRPGRVDILLGLPFVEVLDRAALAAVVAHELAHVGGYDPLLDALLRVRSRLIGDMHGRRSAIRPAEREFLDLTRPVAYQVEFDCDAAAARLVGPAATIRGLDDAQRVAILYDGYLSVVVAPLAGIEVIPEDFYEGWRRWWELPSVLRAAAVTQHDLDAGDAVTATHPNLGQRRAVLASTLAGDPPGGPAPSDAGVLAALEPVELANVGQVRRHLLAAVGPSHATRVPFAAIPPHAYDPSLNSTSRDVLAAARKLAPGTTSTRGVLELVLAGRGTALAEALSPALRDETGGVRARSTVRTLQGGLAALVCAELRHRGWRWADPLTRFVLYPPGGGSGADVDHLVTAFLAGPTGWEGRQLMNLLSQ